MGAGKAQKRKQRGEAGGRPPRPPAAGGGGLPAAVYGATTALCFALALTPLWEQDWGWQVRAGEERLRNRGPLSGRDEWSYTAEGATWHDVQWLATTAMALAHLAAGAAGLVLLRGLLTAALAGGLLATARAVVGRPLGFACSCRAALLALVLLVPLADRIQVRSELFVLAGLAWLYPLASTARDRGGFLGLVGALALFVAAAANAHFGLAPIVAAHACTLCLSHAEAGGASVLRHALGCVVVACAALATPHPVYGLRFFYAHVFYFADKKLSNPDHLRLTAGMALQRDARAVGFWVWGSCNLLAAAVHARHPRARLPRGYRSRPLFNGALAVLFLASLERIRLVPFSVLYMAPVLAVALCPEATGRPEPGPRSLDAGLGLLASVGLGALMWAHQAPKMGLTVSTHEWPIDSAEFLLAAAPAGNVYHSFTFGNYLVYHLRGRYRVYGDTRETIFKHLEAEYLAAYGSPDALGDILERRNINTIVVKIPGTRRLPDGRWEDVIETFTPRERWPIVFFDDNSIVCVRRTERHAALVREHEYMALNPALPFNLWQVDFQTWPPEKVRAFRTEVARCLDRPRVPRYCVMVAASWARTVTDPLLTRDAVRRAMAKLDPKFREQEQIVMAKAWMAEPGLSEEQLERLRNAEEL